MHSTNGRRRIRLVAALIMVTLSPFTLSAAPPDANALCETEGSGDTCCYNPQTYCLGPGAGWLYDYAPCGDPRDCGICTGG